MCCLLIFAALSVSNILHNIQALRTALRAGIAANAAEDFRIQLTDNIIACLNLFDIKGALVNREGINLANAHAFLNLRLAGKHNLQLRAALQAINYCTGSAKAAAAAAATHQLKACIFHGIHNGQGCRDTVLFAQQVNSYHFFHIFAPYIFFSKTYFRISKLKSAINETASLRAINISCKE